MAKFTTLIVLMLSFVIAQNATSEECFKKANSFFKEGKHNKALMKLSECEETDSSLRLRGLIYHNLYNADSSVKYLGKLAISSNIDDTVLLFLSEAFLWKKDFGESRNVMMRVKNKSSIDFKTLTATYFEMIGSFDAALAIYDSLIMQDRKAWPIIIHKAQSLSWLKRFDESIKLFSSVISEHSSPELLRISAVIRRAEVKAWQHEFDSAIQDLDSLRFRYSNVKSGNIIELRIIEAMLLKGQILEWDGKFRDAKETYKNILLLNSDSKITKLRLEKLLWVK